MSVLKTTVIESFSAKQLESFLDYAIDRHNRYCNQLYADRFPYSAHLSWVASNAFKFINLIEDVNDNRHLVIAGAYGHDLLEDARETFNSIKDRWGVRLAEIIYCCTEDKGRNRSARHSADYFMELSKNDLAIFVKLCDIAANVKFSLLDNSGMFDKYKKEFAYVYDYLYTPKYDELFRYISNILNFDSK